ncbi:MAG: polyprenyl synthetase family protein [Synergistaceae bacterium]|jgi:geranylgeranyl diphosphate synthase type II|nr:polyprenyl synthetase family protein [Synergistaceae bacterium]
MSEPFDAVSALSGIYLGKIEAGLRDLCESKRGVIPARLLESMSYSLLEGGKRLRPALCLAVAERGGVPAEQAMPMASALEFVHTASLIHDDLPCFDDDDLRRGRPTNHKIFGECLAVLAGLSLMIWAFEHALSGLVENGIPPERALRAVAYLCASAGPGGMCGGQTLDTDRESQDSGRDFVYGIAEKKTAALIRASVVTGALLAGASDEIVRRYSEYGEHIGIAFQIVDDILDATGTREELGKTPHKDEAQDKKTFVSAYGLDGAKQRAEHESAKAAEALSSLFPGGDLLITLAKQLAHRSR